MIHRSTSFRDAKACVRLHHLRYDLGLVPVKGGEKSVDLLFGSLIHDGIEVLTNQDLPSALEFIDSVDLPPDKVKTPAVAKALVRMFSKSNRTKIIVPERNFSFEGKNYTWKGRHDGIASYNDMLYVMEYKTTNPWYLQFRPNDQFTAYYIGAKLRFPDLEGVMVVNLDPTKVEVHYHLLRFTDEYCSEWLEEVQAFTDYLLQCSRNQVFPKTESSCFAYGRLCPFHPICSDLSPSFTTTIINRCFKEDQTLLEKSW